MEKLPGYLHLVKGLGSVNGIPMVDHDAGDEYHFQTKEITKAVIAETVDRGQNMLVDASGRNTEKLEAKVDFLKDRGYKVHIMHASLPVNLAWKRSTSGLPERNYRTVPMHTHESTNPGYGVEAIKEHLGSENIEEVDSLTVVDTSDRLNEVTRVK